MVRSTQPRSMLLAAAVAQLASQSECALAGAHAPLALSQGRLGVGRAAMAMATEEIATPGRFTKTERMRSRYGGAAFQPEEGWTDAALNSGFSYEELSASVGEMLSFERGDTCDGVVLGFEPNGALVDIGVKSSAYVTLTESAIEKPSRPEEVFELGGSYTFQIISREDENGQLMLSRRRILYDEAWGAAAEILAEDKSVEATVVAVNRGGAMMSVNGLRAFLPGSHYLPGQTPPEELVGSKLSVKLLDVDRDNNRLVVSHRKALVDQTIKNMSVGSVLEGVVTAVKPYGAFIDVGGMSGLLHISQISCDHISNVESVLPLGKAIKCMVISQDKGKGRVALSTKTLEAEPGDMLKNQDKVFAEAEATAAKYQERLQAERKAREEAAQDVIFGLESVFSESGESKPAENAELPFES